MGLCMNLAKKIFVGCCALSSAFLINASAAEKYPAVVGKNGWLFYENEFNPLIEERGVKVRACGTCLDFFDIREKLIVGEAGKMPETVAGLMTAEDAIVLS